MKAPIILILIVVTVLSSCDFFQKSTPDENVAVEVGEYKLYQKELDNLVLKGISAEDSAIIVNNFIENWIKEKLVLQKAELNLDQNQQDFKKQLEDYRTTLLIYTYEKELIKQKLDTSVTDAEIKAYFDNHPENFVLTNDIVRAQFIKVPANAPKIPRLKKIFTSTKEKDIKEVRDYAHQYAEKFYFNTEQWITVDDLKKEFPLHEKEKVVDAKSNILMEDSLAHYFVKVDEILRKGDLAPLEFEKENIKNIIINKRKLNLLRKLKNDLYQQAISSKKVKIYAKKDEE
ncbi:MAG TPA: hypothetical protein VKZ45_05825 [Vicingaceae bacterium]|nr:hypothetical protein [Vicingaceae bacterium]